MNTQMSNDVLIANIQTINELLSRTDIATYARSAMERLLTSLTFELERRALVR